VGLVRRAGLDGRALPLCDHVRLESTLGGGAGTPDRYCPCVLRIGLTGGIGSGKSTVSALLAARGAVVIDADRIAREVVEPGTPGLAAIVAAFGDRMLRPDGSLDRPALAGVVFADPEARKQLDGIVHPLVRARSAELAAVVPGNAVVVHDVPLLVETGQTGSYDLVLVVRADPEVRVRRLVQRGLSEEDARARIGAQATDEQRRAVADVVLDNDGTEEDLAAQVERFWIERVAPAAG
jgi:dephospho-CoA kinase